MNRVIGSVIIVVGLYAVLWGKYREEKEDSLKKKLLLQLPEVVKDTNATAQVNGNIQVLVNNEFNGKNHEDYKFPSVAINLTPSKDNQQA